MVVRYLKREVRMSKKSKQIRNSNNSNISGRGRVEQVFKALGLTNKKSTPSEINKPFKKFSILKSKETTFTNSN